MACEFSFFYIANGLPQEILKNHASFTSSTMSLQKACNFPDNNNDDSPDLDYDAVEEVLRRLPFPSLIRAKSVCKAWNRTILDNTFNFNDETHHFVMQGFHGIAFFSTALNGWFRIPFPWKSHYETELHGLLDLCAASAGFFLFVNWYSLMNRINHVIFNPLTKQKRILPHVPPIYMLMDARAAELIVQFGHFKIITVAFQVEASHAYPLLYNSATDKWTPIPVSHAVPITSFSKRHPWTSAVNNGVVYITNNYSHHLGCYDIASGEFQFKEIEGGLPPQMDIHDQDKNLPASLPSLVTCRGKLLLVGRLLKKAGEASILGRVPFIEYKLVKHTLVGIWELDSNAENNKSWSLISVTPRDLLEDSQVIRWNRFYGCCIR